MISLPSGASSPEQRHWERRQQRICSPCSQNGPFAKDTEVRRSFYPSECLKDADQRLVTESATVVCSTIPSDVYFGSSGSLLPGIEARIVTPEGEEVTKFNTPGELWVKGPAITLGYLNNQKATEETFVDGYLRTGDEAVIKKHPKSGHEHIFIVDRLKELIKVNVSAAGMDILEVC